MKREGIVESRGLNTLRNRKIKIDDVTRSLRDAQNGKTYDGLRRLINNWNTQKEFQNRTELLKMMTGTMSILEKRAQDNVQKGLNLEKLPVYQAAQGKLLSKLLTACQGKERDSINQFRQFSINARYFDEKNDRLRQNLIRRLVNAQNSKARQSIDQLRNHRVEQDAIFDIHKEKLNSLFGKLALAQQSKSNQALDRLIMNKLREAAKDALEFSDR